MPQSWVLDLRCGEFRPMALPWISTGSAVDVFCNGGYNAGGLFCLDDSWVRVDRSYGRMCTLHESRADPFVLVDGRAIPGRPDIHGAHWVIRSPGLYAVFSDVADGTVVTSTLFTFRVFDDERAPELQPNPSAADLGRPTVFAARPLFVAGGAATQPMQPNRYLFEPDRPQE